jgi:hypothetical protein
VQGAITVRGRVVGNVKSERAYSSRALPVPGSASWHGEAELSSQSSWSSSPQLGGKVSVSSIVTASAPNTRASVCGRAQLPPNAWADLLDSAARSCSQPSDTCSI